MPESVPVAQQSPEIIALVEQMRAQRPGLAVDSAVAAVAGQDTATRGLAGSGLGWNPRPTVPWEIANWSPRVHSLASQAIHGRVALNAMVSGGGDPVAREDRDDLRAAFQQMTDRMAGYLPGGSRQSAPIGTAVLDARASLRTGDLDGALHHLTAADDLRRRLHGPDAGRQLSTEEASRGALPDATDHLPGGGEATAVSNGWRSDMTAAAEVRAQVRESAEATTGAPAVEPVRQEEVEMLERVHPVEARRARQIGGRMDWPHRRPERAAEPTPGRQLGRSVDGPD